MKIGLTAGADRHGIFQAQAGQARLGQGAFIASQPGDGHVAPRRHVRQEVLAAGVAFGAVHVAQG